MDPFAVLGPAADLERSLGAWDARLVDYDVDRYPFAERIRDLIRELGHGVERLETLHEVVPDGEVYVLSKELCDATNRSPFRELVHEFVREEIVPKGGLVPPVAVQRFLNVRIMLPDKPQAVFPFHTGLLYGHGQGSRSLWLPLTDVSQSEQRSATLQIIGLARSRELIRQAGDRELSIQEMTQLFGRESHGVRAAPGQVLLFTQEHIHGNFVNRTGKTRVSIDFRLAEARFGDRLARKIPGGYFELLPEERSEREPAEHPLAHPPRENLIYINNNTPSTFEVPPHLQRSLVYDYCARHALRYEFELFELETMDHLPTLLHVVEELRSNAILYSIYALPVCRERRTAILDAAVRNGVVLCFVNEDVVVRTEEDRQKVERILDFAKYGEARAPSAPLKSA